MSRWLKPSLLAPCAIIVAVAAMVVWANLREGRDRARPSTEVAITARDANTSRDALDRRIADLQTRIAANPDDVSAVMLLTESLIRQSRVTGSGGAVLRADAVVRAARIAAPEHYGLLQMEGQLRLSQHKFQDAIEIAERCIALRPKDALNYGVLGDAHLELGNYDEAFAAFDTMMQLRPSAAAYARASYARELQGDLNGALEAMRMSADATGGADVEGLAWAQAQAGELQLRLGRPAAAMQDFAAASQAFPGHPFAVAGYARALAAQGKFTDALAVLHNLLSTAPTPDLHAQAGELFERLGRSSDATREYALAEAAWRSDAPEPRNLARFLADRGTKIDDAVRVAEEVAASRHDIFTQDALAWAYFRAGRLADAQVEMNKARRTGSRDRELLRHAAAINAAIQQTRDSATVPDSTVTQDPVATAAAVVPGFSRSRR